MRILVKVVGYAACIVIIVMVGQYAFTTSDNALIGAISAFLYGLIAFGALAGPAITARTFRYNKIGGLFVAAVTAACFVAAVSNEIEAMTDRGDGQQAGRTLVADTVQDARRSLKRAESEREALKFMPADDLAVQAARTRADAATSAKNAECTVRGSKCQAKETAEIQALAGLEAVTRDKALTDQAAVLDTKIAALRAEIKKAGPVLQAAPGKAFASLLGLPDTDNAKVATWKLSLMMIVAEFLIMALLLVSEIFDKHERPAPARASIRPVARREAEEGEPGEVIEHEEFGQPEAPYAALEPARETPRPLPAPRPVIERPAETGAPRVHAAARRAAEAAEGTPAPAKPRLIASQPKPIGSVVTIMAEIMEPGRSKVEFAEAYAAYAEACEASGKRPVAAAEFASALSELCDEYGIAIQDTGNGLYLLKTKIRRAKEAAQ